MNQPPDTRRCVPVQLTSIPLERRLKAADQVNKFEPEAFARIEIALAARYPSDRVYWVAKGVAA